MSLWKPSITVGLLLGVSCLAPGVRAASPAGLAGGIIGQVRSTTGIPQMGATVLLYNGFDELVRQALTTDQGKFAFESLAPEVYSIRVTLASFVPAIRRNIAVAANSQSTLEISLASVLSTVELVPAAAPHGTLMNDDWKWVLRTSHATRPVLRFLPDPGSSSSSPDVAGMFSATTGVVKLSAGDGDSFAGGVQQDLGTAFALATSVYHSGRVQLSGNFGYAANSGMPAAGFRTSYTRTGDDGSSPEIVLTVRQLYIPVRGNLFADVDNAPVLRTVSLTTLDKIDLSDNLRLDYGFGYDAVSFLDRLNYVSPFARATYDLGKRGAVRAAFSSGTQPTELLSRNGSGEPGSDLDQGLTALALMPRVSWADGHARVERTQDFEIGYERVAGRRTYSAGAYSESVSNAAFLTSGPVNSLPSRDLLADFSSSSSIFNVGSYHRVGYTAAVSEELTDHLRASVAVGRTGALVADGGGVSAVNDAEPLRGLIHVGQRPWVTARLSGAVRGSGTRIAATYGWTDFRALMPAHLFLTQQTNQDIGWNVYLHQPLPMFSGMPWRLEATAELRNLMAQGYLPLNMAGSKTILTNSPRAVRGGLNFIF